MLRLNVSRISLDRKDLDFHLKTHQRRQAARGHGHSPIDLSHRYSGSPRSVKSKKSSSVQSPTKKLITSPGSILISEQYEEKPVVSRDPVPRGSKAFWDRVLAEAGTPTRTQITGSGNATVIDPTEDWLEDHRSTRASMEEDRNLDTDSQDDPISSDDARGPADFPHHQSSLDSFQSTHVNIPDHITRRQSITASLESLRYSTKQKRFSNIFRRRPRSCDAVEEIQQETSDLGFDGHQSEMQLYHDQDCSNSSSTSRAPSIVDGLYGSRRDRRTISSSLDISLIHESTLSQPAGTDRVQRSYTTLPGTALTIPIDARRPSATISRSPLHMSEVPPPASPKISSVDPSGSRHRLLGGLSNFLSLPPRRPRTYRPRSETYSYNTSEASSSTTQVRERPATPAHVDFGESFAPGTDADHAVSSARSVYSFSPAQMSLGGTPAISRPPPKTPTEMVDHRAISHNTSLSNTSSSYRSSCSSLSPYALPFVPQTTPTRNLTPQYQLPPPFGATLRTVSYSQAMPASSSPMTPQNTSPATPPRSSFRVYNDFEPPHTQPETPADLHRRRRYPLRNTSQAHRPRVTPLEHGIARWQAFASPPRSGRTPTRLRPARNPVRMDEMVSLDVENEDTIPMLDRERRRVWNAGLRMGQEERRGLDLSPGLMGRQLR